MKGVIELILAFFLFILLLIPMSLIALIIKSTSKGPAIYFSKRIGRNNNTFFMPKFRTMNNDTPQLATHLMTEPEKYYTPFGKFIRKNSLDELPQIWSIMKGDMSFIGPRPALYNQEDLINLRIEKGIHKLKPGVTGWAQVNGRDEITIPEKVSLEEEYLNKVSWKMDVYILWLTFVKVLKKDNITH